MKMLTIIVNSTKKYANKTLPILIESFQKYKKDYNPNIIFIIGGYDEYKVRKMASYTFIEVDNNTIDYTGLIAILEYPILTNEHFLYIHDTIVIGETFFERVSKLPEIPTNTTVSFQYPSSFIGIYSTNVLTKFKEYILNMKNKDYSNMALQRIKHECVLGEDSIFRMNHENHLFFPTKSEPKWGTTVNIYTDDIPRLPEYYSDLDFLKYKATWGRNDTYTYSITP